MIVSVFTPVGIVVATSTSDCFYEFMETEDGNVLTPIKMNGLPHTHIFWGRYSFTFNCLNQYSYESDLLPKLRELTKKWDTIPPITDFMPYLKKLFVDSHIQVIGIMAAYDKDGNGALTPFVYQILGENIRRINLDNEGNINYNCVYLEKKPHIGKLLQQTKLRNGELWEDNPAINLRCDLYSIQKSIDLCRFMLRTSDYVENVNSASYDDPLKADVSIITCDNIETKTMNI